MSPSSSISASDSPSLSASPSIGYSLYSRGDEISLPSGTNDLQTLYTDQEETDVSDRDLDMVEQTGTLQYMMHQFKKFVGANTFCTVEVEAQSTLAASLSTIYLQIYNRVSGLWETLDTETQAPQDVNFELFKKITDLSEYKDSTNVVTCRVYQLALE